MCFSIKTERSLYYYDAKLKKRLQISPTLHGFLSFLLGKYFKGKEDGQKGCLFSVALAVGFRDVHLMGQRFRFSVWQLPSLQDGGLTCRHDSLYSGQGVVG